MNAFVRRQPKQDEGVQNPASDGQLASGRPPKRQKLQEVKDSESEDSDSSFSQNGYRKPQDGASSDAEARDQKPARLTDVENALPPTQSNEEAIEEYEAFKSSQVNASQDGLSDKTPPMWMKGRSSIYVDAFNLALDTVLDEESHLFDAKEMDVFLQWRELDYEAQYLYVSPWHVGLVLT